MWQPEKVPKVVASRQNFARFSRVKMAPDTLQKLIHDWCSASQLWSSRGQRKETSSRIKICNLHSLQLRVDEAHKALDLLPSHMHANAKKQPSFLRCSGFHTVSCFCMWRCSAQTFPSSLGIQQNILSPAMWFSRTSPPNVSFFRVPSRYRSRVPVAADKKF